MHGIYKQPPHEQPEFSPEVIGGIIRTFRTLRGMNQTELGKYLHLHQTAISRIESGAQQLSLPEWFVVAEVLSIPLEFPTYSEQGQKNVLSRLRRELDSHARV